MHGIVKFLIVLLRSLLFCFCTVLLSEDNTIQSHAINLEYWTTLKVPPVIVAFAPNSCVCWGEVQLWLSQSFDFVLA